MKKSWKACIALLTLVAVVCVFGGCDKEEPPETVPKTAVEVVYAKAQDLGFEGTLDEFLAIVAGKDGETGAKGDKGDDGEKGEDGEKGDKGDDGDKGDTGEKGDTGAAGANGKSAFELACDAGYSGSEAQWLETLKGLNGLTPHIGENGNWFIGDTDLQVSAKGEKGDKGDTGDKGDAGAAGENGLTPHIGENGNWFIGETDLNIKAAGSVVEINEKGYLLIDGVDTGILMKPEEAEVSPFVFYPIQQNGTLVGYAFGVGSARYFDRVEVPGEFLGIPVTTIAYEGFAGCRNMAVVIPASVETVDVCAFYRARNVSVEYLGECLSFEDGSGEMAKECVTVTDYSKFTGDFGWLKFERNEVQVHFDSGDGVLEGETDVTYVRGETYELPIPVSNDPAYLFDCWFVENYGMEVQSVEQLFQLNDSNLVLTARYKLDASKIEAAGVYVSRNESKEIVGVVSIGEKIFYASVEKGEFVRISGGRQFAVSYDMAEDGTCFMANGYEFLFDGETKNVSVNGTVFERTETPVYLICRSDFFGRPIGNATAFAESLPEGNYRLFDVSTESGTEIGKEPGSCPVVAAFANGEVTLDFGDHTESRNADRYEEEELPETVKDGQIPVWFAEFGGNRTEVRYLSDLLDADRCRATVEYREEVGITVNLIVDGKPVENYIVKRNDQLKFEPWTDETLGKFRGWQDGNGMEFNESSQLFQYYADGETVELTAVFEKRLENVTVTFNAGDGVLEGETTRVYSMTETAEFPKPVPNDKNLIFSHWATAEGQRVNGSGDLFSFGQEKLALTAVYIENPALLEFTGVYVLRDAAKNITAMFYVWDQILTMDLSGNGGSGTFTFKDGTLIVDLDGKTLEYLFDSAAGTLTNGETVYERLTGSIFFHMNMETGEIFAMLDKQPEGECEFTDLVTMEPITDGNFEGHLVVAFSEVKQA